MVEKKKMYESTRRAIAEYSKNQIVRINLALNKKTDAELIEHMNNLSESKNGYIRRLIREDIERSRA